MTDALQIDLKQLIDPDILETARDQVKAALDEEQGGHWRSLTLEALGSQVQARLSEQLAAFDMLTLFAEGWAKARELNDAPDVGEKTVALGEHTLDGQVHPVVTVSYAKVLSRDIRFTVKFQAAFAAVRIRAIDRQIVAVVPGRCELGAQLKYGDAKLIGDNKLKTFEIPGELTLPRPIKLGPRAH